jgi:hypothetical protein
LTTARPDDARQAILSGVQALWQDGATTELRALKTNRGTRSGYFDDVRLFAKATYELDKQNVPAVYALLNPAQPELLSRAKNRVVEYARDTTQDAHIVRRSRLLVDLDAKRPSGISATNEEHEAALSRAIAVREHLRVRGWTDPLYVDSGNGAHLIYAIDLANDRAATTLAQGVLRALSARFTDAIVEVDETVHNAARIVKIPGTMARKGDNVAERPHRRSQIIDAPESFGNETVTEEQLRILVADETQKKARQGEATPRSGLGFDLEAFIAHHLTLKRGPDAYEGGQRYIIECPFDAEHGGTSAAIIRLSSDAIVFKCQHNGCRRKLWSDVREQYEAGYRERRDRFSAGSTQSETKTAPGVVEGLETIGQLLDAEVDHTEFLVEGLVPLGGIALLSAKPKCGKSVLAQNLALEVARGGEILGRRCRQGTVLYLAMEERRETLLDRFRALGATHELPIHFRIGRAPQEAMAWLLDAARTLRPALVVVDTLVRLIRLEDIERYGATSNALEPLLALSREHGIAQLWLHHNNKSGDTTNSVSGSNAIVAAVDTTIIMRRGEDGMRTAFSEQRIGDDMEELVLKMDADTYKITSAGSRLIAEQRAAEQTILDRLDAPMTREDIAKLAGLRLFIGRRAAGELIAVGLIKHTTGTGRRGDPKLYERKATTAADLPDEETQIHQLVRPPDYVNSPDEETKKRLLRPGAGTKLDERDEAKRPDEADEADEQSLFVESADETGRAQVTL